MVSFGQSPLWAARPYAPANGLSNAYTTPQPFSLGSVRFGYSQAPLFGQSNATSPSATNTSSSLIPTNGTVADLRQAIAFFTQALLQDTASSITRSPLPGIRAKLTEQGYDGSGVTVQLVEVNQSPHASAVNQVVNDPIFGVAPGAKTKLFSYSDATNVFPDTQAQADLWKEVLTSERGLGGALADELTAAAETLDDIVTNADAETRVINLSWGNTLANTFAFVDSTVAKNPDLKPLVYGESTPTTAQARFEKAMAFVNKETEKPEYKAALKAYQDATKRAADNGMVVVVAAGNDENIVNYIRQNKVTIPDGTALNELAKSDYVLTAASANNLGTPYVLGDDKVSTFSSKGAAQWGPTVAAPGESVPVQFNTQKAFIPWGTRPLQNQVSGTSFSAPFISGTVALMLDKDPTLTFSQIKQAIQSTATNTATPASSEGAGILDIFKAVLGSAPTWSTAEKAQVLASQQTMYNANKAQVQTFVQDSFAPMWDAMSAKVNLKTFA